METLHPRYLRPPLLEALADTRVVFVAGARQVGKSTLTREIAAGEHPMTILSLDEAATRDAASPPPLHVKSSAANAVDVSTKKTASTATTAPPARIFAV